MMYSTLVPYGWLIHLPVCFYFVRSFRSFLHRALLTLLPCLLFIFVGCSNLPYFHMSSVMTVSLYWMITIRLIHLIVLSPDQIQSFRLYLWKFLWFLIPIEPCQSKESIGFYLLSTIVKLLVNHWIYQWLRVCEPNDSYGRIAMFYIFVCAGTFVNDLQVILIRLITRDKYSVLEFNDYPFLSKSIREFWGRRYNRLVGSLLKESIFDPIRRWSYSSATIGALASFIMSGLLHAHVAVVGFGAPSPLPAFFFFILQGLACCLVSILPVKVPKPIGILLTQGFLLVTAPLYLGLFTRADPVFYEYNKPPFLDQPWFPKLPVPRFCPK